MAVACRRTSPRFPCGERVVACPALDAGVRGIKPGPHTALCATIPGADLSNPTIKEHSAMADSALGLDVRACIFDVFGTVVGLAFQHHRTVRQHGPHQGNRARLGRLRRRLARQVSSLHGQGSHRRAPMDQPRRPAPHVPRRSAGRVRDQRLQRRREDGGHLLLA